MDEKRDIRVKESGSFLPIVVGFLAGAVSATAAALLLAPASGGEARAAIGGAYRKSAEKAGRLPAAIRSAGIAARAAFAEARAEEPAVAAKHEAIATYEGSPAGTNNH